MLFSAAQYATLAPTKEAPSLVPSSCLRHADILLPHCSRGCPAALDVSVISPLQHLTLAGTASSPGHAFCVGVRRKMSSNLPACRSAEVDFLPIVVETLGRWCPDAITTICSIGQVLGQRLNSTNPADSTKHLFGRLAVALWQGNAALWMHRQPTLPFSGWFSLICLLYYLLYFLCNECKASFLLIVLLWDLSDCVRISLSAECVNSRIAWNT